jgi:elongation factor G
VLIRINWLRAGEEDPTFNVHSDQETEETLLSGMGELHLEIIVDRLKVEYGVTAIVGQPKVAYKETITGETEENHKYAKQSGGRGQYGHVVFHMLPAKPGEGFEFINSIKGGSIPKEYIPAVEKGVIEALHEGAYAGFPVVDVKVELIDGSYHEVDSSEIAFKIAARECFKRAFMKCMPILLEPYMSLEIITPEEHVGSVVGHLCSKRGKVLGIESKGPNQIIDGEAPLAELFGYATTLRSLSSGRASYSMHFERYMQVPFEMTQKVIEEKKASKGK